MAASSDGIADSAAHLDVAIQLSRFHLETLEGGGSIDVDIRGLNLTVKETGKILLEDAHLALKAGVRYGLIGRNGCGKSSLLKAIASKSIPNGLPKYLRILYVQQDNVPGDERSVLQTVVEGGSSRSRLQAQVAALEAALDNEADDPDTLVALVQSLVVREAQEQQAEAEKVRNSRSRARGKEAIRALVEATAAAEQVERAQMSAEEAGARAPQLLSELYEALEGLDASEEEEQAAAASILSGLGFTPDHQAMSTQALSGGWRMRAALAIGLMCRPHLLLLDEPTNHLDVGSILWLQDYLTTQCEGQTIVVVSHDRAFLDAVGQETMLLRDARLEYFLGSYDAYMQAKAEASLSKERQVTQQEKQRAALLDTIARAERAAKVSGDDKRLGQAASRRKKIDRLGVERVDGKRFKRSYWAGYHDTQRPQVALDRPEEPVVLQLPLPDALRQLGPLLQVSDVSISYAAAGRGSGRAAAALPPAPAPPPAAATTTTSKAASGSKKQGKAEPTAPPPPPPLPPGTVLQGVSMTIEQGARVGLVGLNGAGKSSLLRVLAGTQAPSSGLVTSPCPRLQIGYVDQHSGSALLKDHPPGTTAFAAVQAAAPTLRDQEVYDYLGKFNVPGPLAMQPLAGLSGGQRRRVALALTMQTRPHLLILDEPTNHLDLMTVQALSEALVAWEGTAIITSHDLAFMEDTCSEVWVVEGGAVQRLPQAEVGDALDEYAARLMEALRKAAGRRQRAQQQKAQGQQQGQGGASGSKPSKAAAPSPKK